jgi:transcriptional regulator with XRE-family HTH domain
VSADRGNVLARPGRNGAPLVDRAKLAQLRHERGWTQAMLADYAGLSTDIVRKLEQGAKRSARLSTLSALARALNVPVGVLLGDTPVSDSARALARQADETGEPTQAAEPYRPTLMRTLIAERHWQRFKTFEAQFRRAARELAGRERDPDLAKLTVSSRQWERWYSGNVKTEPHPDACRVLEHMFGYPVKQLLATRETDSNQQHGPSDNDRHQYGSLQPLDKWARVLMIPPGSLWFEMPAEAPVPEAGTLAVDLPAESGSEPMFPYCVEGEDEGIVRRRSFIVSAAALTGMGVSDPVSALRTARRGLHGSFPGHGDADVSEWNQIAWDYGETYLIIPPGQLLKSLLSDLAGLQEAFLRNPQGTAQRELWRASALLSGFVAQTANNLGYVTEARQWWRTARYSAQRSEDAFSVLWVRVREIIHAWHQLPDATVLRLIEDAEQFAGCAPAEPVLQLLWAKARTLAMLGYEAEAENTLVQLRERFAATPASGASRSLLVSGVSRLYDAESFVYSRLGNDKKAESALHETSALFKGASTNVRWAAEVEMQSAFCLARKGDVTEGVVHARDVILGLPPSQRTQNFFFDARDVLNAIPQPEQKRPVVTQYREWLNSASRQPAFPA